MEDNLKRLEMIHDTLIEIDPIEVSQQTKENQELIESVKVQLARALQIPREYLGFSNEEGKLFKSNEQDELMRTAFEHYKKKQ